MINVLNAPNVHGDGVQDDWEGIQDLIDAAETGGDGTFYFPPARYRINSTLEFPQKSGYHLIGSGLVPPLFSGDDAVGAESVIIWGGADNGTMIKYQGVGLLWNGLSLWGCALGGSSSSCPAARALHGIKVNKPGGAPGTGKAWFDSILIAHCKEAIATSNTLNNDTLGFGFCWFEDCDIGLRLVDQQSLQYTFQHVHAKDVGTIFRVDHNTTGRVGGGGRIFTQLVSVQSDDTIVLDLKGGGSNSGYHQLGGVVVKDDATNVKLLDSVTSGSGSGGSHVVRFTDGHFRNTTKVNVDRSNNGRTTLEFVGCRGMDALEGEIFLEGQQDSTERSILIVRDCDLTALTDPDVIGNLIKSGSTYYWAHGQDNWDFASGTVMDSDASNPS